MALGKIKADTLEHSTAGSLTTDYVVNGSAKQWMKYVQTTNTLSASLNTSSVTDSSAGNFVANLASSMSQVDYNISVTTREDNSNANYIIGVTSISTSSYGAATWRLTVGYTDSYFNFGNLHGDLA